jgi:ubiquinone/menaquinone biosynthesis C-methylase UbiE
MASALSGQQDYKCIAEKYSKNNAIQIKLGQQFVSLLELGYGQKVLDMGCGTGELTAYTANQVGFENVFGVDPDPNRIEIAIQTAKNIRQFTVGNSSSVFPHSDEEFYDVFFSNFVFHWLNTCEKKEYLNRAVKCLKPGGRLAIHSADEWPQPIAALLEMAVAVNAMKPALYFVGRTAVDSMCKSLALKFLPARLFSMNTSLQALSRSWRGHALHSILTNQSFPRRPHWLKRNVW